MAGMNVSETCSVAGKMFLPQWSRARA